MEKQPDKNQSNIKEIHKAYAYIVQLDQVLVFRHADYPEAGIQIPGGTVRGKETYSQAAMREIFEETGIQELILMRKLGVSRREEPLEKDGERFAIYDHFFHFISHELLPEEWDHYETRRSDGGEPLLFSFFWMPFLEAKQKLVSNHAEFIDMFNR